MGYIFLIIQIGIAVGSFVFSLLAFLGKEMILDDVYLKATKDEREAMDKDAYRLQGAVIFLLIFLMSLSNLLRMLTASVWFTIFSSVFLVATVMYATVSHYILKRKHKVFASPCASPDPDVPPVNVRDIPPMDKPDGFSEDAAWREDIKRLSTEEVYARYTDADGDWTDDYRYLCYEELTARQQTTDVC